MAETIIETLVQGGKASAGPPLGPALGPVGVNIGAVVAEINKQTAEMKGMSVPVKVIVNLDDKTFKIEIGTPPTSGLLKKEAGIEKGTGTAGTDFVADLKIEQVIKIAKIKKTGVLAKTLKSAVKEVIGTCQSLGIKIEGLIPKEAIKAINDGRWAETLKD